jgi:hypothetical protein
MRRVWGEWRLAEDRDVEARLGEGVRHGVQRPVPKRQHRALFVEGVLLRILGGGEVVGVRVEQLVDDGVVHRQDEAAAASQRTSLDSAGAIGGLGGGAAVYGAISPDQVADATP